mgnify:CR=1 FL=1
MRQRTSYAHCPPALEVARISAHSAQLTFVENAVQVSAPDGAAAWEADVYTLVVPWQDDLYDMVESRYGGWLDHAKDKAYEHAAAEIRERRDALLLNCDWTQAQDVPITNDARNAWREYRQALRDIPEQPGFPWDVTWPEV